MRLMKDSLVVLVLGGIMALGPTVAFAHGGGLGGRGHFRGRGGHFLGGGGRFVGGGGRFVGGGGHFVGGGGRFVGGGSHFAGFTGHSFAGRSFAEHQGERFARDGDRFRDHFRDEDHFRLRDHFDGDCFIGDPFAYDYPYYGFDYPDYGYDNNNAGDYSDGQSSPPEVILSQYSIVAV